MFIFLDTAVFTFEIIICIHWKYCASDWEKNVECLFSSRVLPNFTFVIDAYQAYKRMFQALGFSKFAQMFSLWSHFGGFKRELSNDWLGLF